MLVLLAVLGPAEHRAMGAGEEEAVALSELELGKQV